MTFAPPVKGFFTFLFYKILFYYYYIHYFVFVDSHKNSFGVGFIVFLNIGCIANGYFA